MGMKGCLAIVQGACKLNRVKLSHTPLSMSRMCTVMQASFDPPGLTVAVKKDRAMEPLLMVGACVYTVQSALAGSFFALIA
jgi:hypothetical protein